MPAKLFYRILAGLVILCLVLTLCHLAYCLYAYQHCSIIYFVGKELW